MMLVGSQETFEIVMSFFIIYIKRTMNVSPRLVFVSRVSVGVGFERVCVHYPFIKD